MEHASRDIVRGHVRVDGQGAGVREAVAPDGRPVRVRLTVRVGEREVGGAVRGVRGRDGRRDEARGCVDELAYGRGAVDCVGDLDAVLEAEEEIEGDGSVSAGFLWDLGLIWSW